MDYTHPPLTKNADKVDFIYKFLLEEAADSTSVFEGASDRMDCFLIIIGEGGSGKSYALNQATSMLEREGRPYRVMVWNEKEKPYLLENKYTAMGAAWNTMWVLIRRQEDPLTLAFQREWTDTEYSCQAVRFLAEH